MNDRADRARVYEQVLREGMLVDVHYYVDAGQLAGLSDKLVLPHTRFGAHGPADSTTGSAVHAEDHSP